MDSEAAERFVKALLSKIALNNVLSSADTKALLDVIEKSGLPEIEGKPLRDYFAERRRLHQQELMLNIERQDAALAALVQAELDKHGEIWD